MRTFKSPGVEQACIHRREAAFFVLVCGGVRVNHGAKRHHRYHLAVRRQHGALHTRAGNEEGWGGPRARRGTFSQYTQAHCMDSRGSGPIGAREGAVTHT